MIWGILSQRPMSLRKTLLCSTFFQDFRAAAKAKAASTFSALPHMHPPPFVRIVEVGARDGLQNEKKIVPTEIKVELINRLSDAGITTIEAASFVSPKWVPQMSDGVDVMRSINRKHGVRYPVLVPNLKGLQKAIDVNADEIAVFTTASESFCKNNVNSTVAESLEKCKGIIDAARQQKIRIRGYVSCIVDCPYEGRIEPSATASVAEKLFEMGCYEISLGDTTGVGTPGSVQAVLEEVMKRIPTEHLAVHFHDTYGAALPNIYLAFQRGIRVVDTSVAGLGGCPFSPGASGNVATEDVVYMLNGMGIKTGVDLRKVISAGEFVCKFLDRPTKSKVALALQGRERAQQKNDDRVCV